MEFCCEFLVIPQPEFNGEFPKPFEWICLGGKGGAKLTIPQHCAAGFSQKKI